MEYKLEEICEFIRNGASIKQNDNIVGYPITRIETIANSYIDLNRMGYAGIVELGRFEEYLLSDGDILMSHINSEKHLGKTAIYENCKTKIIHGMNLLCLRPRKELVIPKYLNYYFNNVIFRKQLPKITKKSVNQASFSVTDLKNIKISLPEKDIQIKIVEILDKAQELIDKRKEQIKALDELVKSKFIEMFSDVNEYVSVSEYIESLTAGKSLAGESECKNKVLNTGSISYDYFDMDQVKNLPNDYVPKEEHLVNVGDVLISRMNTSELVGATAYVWNVNKNTYIPDRLWKANFKANSNPIFVWQLLIQSSTKEKIRRIASGTSGSMKNISKSGLLGIEVIKIGIEKQNEFADFVKQVDKLKTDMEKSLKELEDNFNSLIQRTFKGELFN